MVNYCSVCPNNSKANGNASFFTYPKDPEIRAAWLKASLREDLVTKLNSERRRPHYRICDKHFEQSCFIFSKNRNVRYLNIDAFPTLNLPKISKCRNAVVGNQLKPTPILPKYYAAPVVVTSEPASAIPIPNIPKSASTSQRQNEPGSSNPIIVRGAASIPVLFSNKTLQAFPRTNLPNITDATQRRNESDSSSQIIQCFDGVPVFTFNPANAFPTSNLHKSAGATHHQNESESSSQIISKSATTAPVIFINKPANVFPTPSLSKSVGVSQRQNESGPSSQIIRKSAGSVPVFKNIPANAFPAPNLSKSACTSHHQNESRLSSPIITKGASTAPVLFTKKPANVFRKPNIISKRVGASQNKSDSSSKIIKKCVVSVPVFKNKPANAYLKPVLSKSAGASRHQNESGSSSHIITKGATTAPVLFIEKPANVFPTPSLSKSVGASQRQNESGSSSQIIRKSAASVPVFKTKPANAYLKPVLSKSAGASRHQNESGSSSHIITKGATTAPVLFIAKSANVFSAPNQSKSVGASQRQRKSDSSSKIIKKCAASVPVFKNKPANAFPTPSLSKIACASHHQNESGSSKQIIRKSTTNAPVLFTKKPANVFQKPNIISKRVGASPNKSDSSSKSIKKCVASVPVTNNPENKNNSIIYDILVNSRSVEPDSSNIEILNRGSWNGPCQLQIPDLSEETTRKRKCEEKLDEVTKPVKLDLNRITKEDFLKLCEMFMSKSMSQLMKWQNDFKDGNQNDAFKFFALSLHYTRPAAYKFLKNTFCLPSLTYLRNFVIPIGTEINKRILTALKTKVDTMGPQEKLCSVSVNYMSLKENFCYDIKNDKILGFHEVNGKRKPLIAKYVIVIMVRGIVYEWKQPIAHSFLAHCKKDRDVSNWIDEIISSLIKIGLDVRAFISGLSSDFVSASKLRGVNVDKTYFEVNGHKIYYVFDVPQLIKCVRDNLQTCNFVYGDSKVAKWSDIRDMYKKDRNNEQRLAQKLTGIHIYPKNLLKSRVKLAVQVLSFTVATTIGTYVDLKLMDASARDTAEFVDKFNNLFDMLNSCTMRSSNDFKRAYSGDHFQNEFLKEMLDFFKNLKIENISTKADVTKTMHFIDGFQISIKSIVNLCEDLQSIGIKCIQTRRLNLDALNFFFTKVRETSGNCQAPTCRQFASAFKKLFVRSILITPHGTNCQGDFDSWIMKYEDCQSFSETLQVSSPEKFATEVTSIAVGTNDYKFELPVKNALGYLSGYLYKKCLELHECEKLRSYVSMAEAMNVSDEYKNTTDGNEQSGHFKTPPDSFVAFIGVLEEKFCQYFYLEQHSANVGHGILKLIEHCTFEMLCDCFPIDYLKKLFVRLRIYHAVKQNNINICT